MIKKMNIIDKLHQQFVVDKIKITNWVDGTDAPLLVELDPTAVCDLACPGCISEDIIAIGNSFSSDRLLEIAEELKESGVKGVILIGGGEPLAHPAIGKVIDYFGRNDISVGITTNGTYIHRYLKEIAKFSSWTRVSIDAATSETFHKLRPTKGGISKFESIIEYMKELAKIKSGKLGYSFLIRTEVEGADVTSNVGEIYDAAVLAKEIGCDYFEIKPSYNYKDDVAHSLVRHTDERIKQMKEEISRLDALEDESFSIIKAITLDESLSGVKNTQTKEYTICPATELRTLITPSGVYACPYWRGKEQFKVGNLNNQNFKEMWNSPKRKDIQLWLNPSEHCAGLHCLRHETNLEVLSMIEDIKKNRDIKIIDEYDRFF